MSDYEIQDLSSNHHYRTELPNIIFEIGLTPCLIGVYAAIKRCAGDKGICIKSEKKLSEELQVTKKTLHKLIDLLCEENFSLKTPLIIKKNRISEHGDKDTNKITIVDIWPHNYSHFCNENGGRVNFTPPRVKNTQGVGKILPQGRVKFTHKEELLKKNSMKKTTTTNKEKSSSSFSKEISQEEKDAAKKAFDFILLRSKNDSDEKWNIDLKTLEKYFHVYGIEYTTEQFNYLLDRMNKYRLNKSKPGNKITQIEDPKVYFKKACSENYAKSLHLNELNNKIKKIE